MPVWTTAPGSAVNGVPERSQSGSAITTPGRTVLGTGASQTGGAAEAGAGASVSRTAASTAAHLFALMVTGSPSHPATPSRNRRLTCMDINFGETGDFTDDRVPGRVEH
jgi:hypothetical protein